MSASDPAPLARLSGTAGRRLEFVLSGLLGEWRQLFQRGHLRDDVIAGLSVAAAALPFSLAIAIASGVAPSLGLVSAGLAGLMAALFGGPALAITGPAAGLVVLLAAVVEQHGLQGLLVIGLGCGILQIVLGLTGLGRLLHLVPQAVVGGFSSGIAVCVLIGQMPRLLGLPPPDQSHVLYVLSHLSDEIAGTDPAALAVGLGTIALCVLLPRWLPRVPAPLVATLLAAVGTFFLPATLPILGDISHTFPTPHLPDLSLTAIRSLFASTLMLFALASLEVRRVTTTLGKMTGRTEDRLDQELVGQGLANLLVPFFGSIPVMMVNARSVLNVKAGAATRRAAVIQSLAVLGLALLLGPLLARVPLASLAGILLLVAAKKLNPSEISQLWQRSRSEGAVYVITFLVLVLGDLLAGLQVGLIAAFLIAAARLGQLQVTLRRGGQHLRLSLQGPLTFLSTRSLDPLRNSLAEEVPPSELIIDLTRVTLLDIAGAEMLAELVDQLSGRGTRVALLGLQPSLEPILRGSDPDGHVIARLARHESEVHRLLDAGSTAEPARPIDRLVRGIERFRADMKHYGKLFETLAEGQTPHTLFITCSDSRLVPNLITSTDPGELFVVRNVGNIIPPFNSDQLPAEGAALEYAVSVLGIKEIIVCGHSGCGAMKAIIAGEPTGLPSVDKWLAHARSVRLLGRPTPEDAARFNALRQLEHIATYPIVREKLASGEIQLHAWFFDIRRGQLYGWDDDKESFVVLTGEDAHALASSQH
ncbi:MAG TPA: SulP family inorganic anion transporter [Polyangia bacterium]|jgi:carbonic anhydrase|nr:SulP family inorganic anion transporter [Polyangia bacterium]